MDLRRVVTVLLSVSSLLLTAGCAGSTPVETGPDGLTAGISPDLCHEIDFEIAASVFGGVLAFSSPNGRGYEKDWWCNVLVPGSGDGLRLRGWECRIEMVIGNVVITVGSKLLKPTGPTDETADEELPPDMVRFAHHVLDVIGL